MLPSPADSDRRPSCADHDPEMWFDSEQRSAARAICRPCPLRAACLAESLKLSHYDIPHSGVWGGLYAEQRRKVKVRYRNVTEEFAQYLIDHVL